MARILIFAPHPDDAEIAMGASIAKFIAQGHDVLLCDCTDGEPTPRGSPEIRAREAAEAGRILGVRRFNLGWRNRFVQQSIEARHAAAGVIRAHQAQILFAPYFEDAHPDHLAVTRIVEDAKFDAKLTKLDMPAPPGFAGHPGPTPSPPVYPRWLFYYYASHLRITPNPTFCIDVTGYEEVKRRATLAYASQFVVNERNREVIDWVDSSLRYFGSRIDAAAAEPFFSREPLAVGDLAWLVPG